MMKEKYFKLLALIIIIILFPFFLPRCINVEQKIRLRSNGSGNAEITYFLPERIYKNPVSLQKIRRYIPVDQEDLKKIYQAKPGVKIKGTKTKKGEKLREVSINLAFDRIENISTDRILYRIDDKGDFYSLKVTVLKKDDSGPEMTKGASAENAIDEHGMTQLIGQALSRFHLKLELDLPGKIIGSNKGKIDDDEIEWEMPFSEFYKEDKTEEILEVNYEKKTSLWQKVKEGLGF